MTRYPAPRSNENVQNLLGQARPLGASTQEAAAAPRKRREIWDHGEYQCPILGTCLSMNELKKLARKVKLRLEPGVRDFEIHGMFVSACKKDGPVARAVQKHLDKKYQRVLRRFFALREEAELLALWRDYADAGDIPGPFWAVMRHPETSEELRHDVFGEVHMLSHLVGASNRAEIKRLNELESEMERQEDAHAKARSSYRARLKRLVAELREARVARLQAEQEAEDLRERLGQVDAASGIGTSELVTINTLLTDERARLESLAEGLEISRRQMAKDLTSLAEERDRLREDLADRAQEVEFLLTELSRSRSACPCQGCPEQASMPHLNGARVLYVGGRASLVPRYRELVERMGGTFAHHDGGLEEALDRLPQLLSSADTVLCPVDCVSHGACLKVKAYCKHACKPCRMLRSSGLSTLAQELSALPGETRAAGRL